MSLNPYLITSLPIKYTHQVLRLCRLNLSVWYYVAK